MVPLLPGWQRRCSADLSLFIHPAGAFAGALQYQERVRPLQRLADLIDRVLAQRPMFMPERIEPSPRLLTAEGEYAGLAVIRGRIDSQPAECHVAAVFGDDFQSLLHGVVTQPALFAEFSEAVRVLITLDSHGLGVRRRRCIYSPPSGWQGLLRGFAAEWLPPEFPSDATSITVFPANPLSVSMRDLVQRMLDEDRQQGAQVTVDSLPIPTVAGPLAALHQRIVSTRAGRRTVHRQWAALSDERYSYVAQLESLQPEGLDRHAATFLALLGSIEPLPAPILPPAPSSPSQAVDLWGTD